MTTIEGERVRLRSVTEADVPRLAEIRATPAVHKWWGGGNLESDLREDIADEDLHLLAIEDPTGAIIGAIQWQEDDDPDYRHAGMDVFLDPAVHRQGYGVEAVTTLARYLFDVEGHHRLTIDPAASNSAAIRCYAKAGFREVGLMRQYERDAGGGWHDGILMELLADDLA